MSTPAAAGEAARTANAAALPWFPAVGLIVGAPVGAVLLLPLPELPRAALALALWTGLTGGFHEDGLMDSADAALAPVPRERRLEILKDPHAGAHAVTALLLLLLIRLAALTSVPAAAALAAPVLGRWVMALALARGRPAREDGLGASFACGAGGGGPTVVAFLLIFALAPLAGPARATTAALAALVAGAATAAFLHRRFGGLTGDSCGAAGLIAETAALLAFLPLGRGA